MKRASRPEPHPELQDAASLGYPSAEKRLNVVR